MNGSMRRTGPDWNHASTESGVNLVKHELGTGCAPAIRAEMTAASFESIEVGIGIGLNTLNGWYHEICSMEDE